jgi:catechol 2,3-dioxygenase-like lactoylglutathione lyase family enzyme
MLMIKGLYDVTIYAANIDAMKAFYGSLGLRQIFDKGDLVVYALGAQELAIHVAEHTPLAAVTLSILVDDLVSALVHLKNASVAFDGPKLVQAGLRGVVLTDPNGNRVNVLQARE